MNLNELNRQAQGLSYYDMLEAHDLDDKPAIQGCWKFAHNIKKYCKPYLNQVGYTPMTKDPLYRGIKFKSSGDQVFLTKKVRLNNRKPADSTKYLHNAMNDYFTKQLGKPFRNAIFASGDRSEAAGFGQPYIIFPIGQFTYAWSDITDDLYSDAVRYGLNEGPYKGDIEGIWEQNWESFAKDVLRTYKTDLLDDAIQSGHEIMIRCNSYYALKELIDGLDWEENNNVLKMMEVVLY